MLRMTRFRDKQGTTVRFEGKLLGPWVDEARQSVRSIMDQDGVLELDLSLVSFADQAGEAFLREVAAQGVALRNCSGFLSRLLARESRT